MKVTLSFDKKTKEGTCVVTKEPGDPTFRDGGWGTGESRLLYHVKQILNRRGYDFIKKRMVNDGLTFPGDQQYLRERKTKKRCLVIYNPNYDVEFANEPFNREGKVTLELCDIYEELPETKFKMNQKVYVISNNQTIPGRVIFINFCGDEVEYYGVRLEDGSVTMVREVELCKRSRR